MEALHNMVLWKHCFDKTPLENCFHALDACRHFWNIIFFLFPLKAQSLIFIYVTIVSYNNQIYYICLNKKLNIFTSDHLNHFTIVNRIHSARSLRRYLIFFLTSSRIHFHYNFLKLDIKFLSRIIPIPL